MLSIVCFTYLRGKGQDAGELMFAALVEMIAIELPIAMLLMEKLV